MRDKGTVLPPLTREAREVASVVGRQSAELHHVLQCWAKHHFLDGYARLVRECTLEQGAEDTPAMQMQLRQLFAMLDGSRILTLVAKGPGAASASTILDQYLWPGPIVAPAACSPGSG